MNGLEFLYLKNLVHAAATGGLNHLEQQLLQYTPTGVTPNGLTIFRIYAAIVIALLYLIFAVTFFWPVFWLVLALSVLSGLTDWYDGRLARARGLQSAWGARWDERADKLLIGLMLTVFCLTGLLSGLWVLVALVSIVREIVLTVARGCQFVRTDVGVLFTAKLKTTLQICSVLMLLLSHVVSWLYYGGLVLLSAALLCSLYSAYWYLRWYDMRRSLSGLVRRTVIGD